MAKLVEIDAVIELDRPFDAVERLGATIDGVKVRIVVHFKGITFICESVTDAQELISEAAQQHSRWRFATDGEARDAARRMIDKHRQSLEKLAASDGPVTQGVGDAPIIPPRASGAP
jgi:hypothetical protein